MAFPAWVPNWAQDHLFRARLRLRGYRITVESWIRGAGDLVLGGACLWILLCLVVFFYGFQPFVSAHQAITPMMRELEEVFNRTSPREFNFDN